MSSVCHSQHPSGDAERVNCHKNAWKSIRQVATQSSMNMPPDTDVSYAEKYQLITPGTNPDSPHAGLTKAPQPSPIVSPLERLESSSLDGSASFTTAVTSLDRDTDKDSLSSESTEKLIRELEAVSATLPPRSGTRSTILRGALDNVKFSPPRHARYNGPYHPEPPHTPDSPSALSRDNSSSNLLTRSSVVSQVGTADSNISPDTSQVSTMNELGDLQVYLDEARTLTAVELVSELASLRQLLEDDTSNDITLRLREWALRWTLQSSLRILDPKVKLSEPGQKSADGSIVRFDRA
ncbi:hypothetical protein IWQ60_006617 [Tieghemiomyces parasiticus]|uniref:Uncharacterized protein n=1 Tax=Tieghemiomyces parasiticus TaxID=78921 RepID=A0A9W8DRT8_9FUNG|nr:hypothetical protein IWQ60_006617 [Tieghemiomyces parasiticus]